MYITVQTVYISKLFNFVVFSFREYSGQLSFKIAITPPIENF